jgi:histidinol-phosphate aminotransferase
LGLLDYYRQFEGRSEEEVNRELREQAQQRKSADLATAAPLDLSHTTWPGLPHANVANAITFVARSGLHSYADPRAGALRSALAHLHDTEPARIAIGHGAGPLLSAATCALMEPGQELLCPWPSYPLYPAMAARAHGTAVPVRAPSVAQWVDGVLAALTPETRLVVLARPNDPTGELLAYDELQRLLDGLSENVAVLLDEALIEMVHARPRDDSLALLAEHPRLLVFRSFSKAFGLAGLRVGYALGGPGAEQLLAGIEPELGIGELQQAGALEALRSDADGVARRAAAVAGERRRLLVALRERGFDCSDSEANFVWVSHAQLDGDQLAAQLRAAGVLIAPGSAVGAPAWARAAVQSAEASRRLLAGIDRSLSAG